MSKNTKLNDERRVKSKKVYKVKLKKIVGEIEEICKRESILINNLKYFF